MSQYLSFSVDDQSYGLDILKVQEIKGYSGITPIPNTPTYIKGVMNLRGTVVPVIDLRTKFGLPRAEYDKFTVIVIVTVGSKIAGLLVDAVSDVLDVAAVDVRPSPDFGARADTRYISGVTTIGDKLTVLLDIDRLVGEEEVAAAASN